ncbi:MAG: ribosomal-protein-alanine N-acetyltransferase [Anaerolineaceae bacterium]|nr:ribosomal-protein-alanine N-acetyltransferase [Anaerolineaceae bacterium]
MSKSLNLRYMRTGDIPQVVAIDNQSFNPPWSARSYAYEVSESSYSHMVVLEDTNGASPVNGLRRFLQPWARPGGMIVGYGGLWYIAGEGHISTIAAHPDYRGQGYGEILLAAMVRRAITLQAEYIVLEVRVSNFVAQNLYEKYEFQIVGTKPNYYRADNEDAYDMRLDLADEAMIARFDQRFAEVCAQQQFIDQYTDLPSPKQKSS